MTGLIALMNSEYGLPMNLGNPDEYTVKEFAQLVRELVTGTSSDIVYMPATKDDPAKRKPDITIAKSVLGWQPKVPVREGLTKTVDYFRAELEETGEIQPTGPEAVKYVCVGGQRGEEDAVCMRCLLPVHPPTKTHLPPSSHPPTGPSRGAAAAGATNPHTSTSTWSTRRKSRRTARSCTKTGKKGGAGEGGGGLCG